VSKLPVVKASGNWEEAQVVDTPNTHSIDELCGFLKVPSTVIVKSLVYIVDKTPVIALIRADKNVEETKLMNAVGGIDIRIASSAEIAELMAEKGFDAIPGFIGPKGMTDIPIIADETVKDMKNFVVGINQTDKHMVGANLSDIPAIENYADIRLVEAGDFCPVCGKPLKVTKGIEVGNIFQLGTKYSKPMNAVYLDADGKAKPYIMGCYGIGVTRTAAAAIEAHHDDVVANTIEAVLVKVADAISAGRPGARRDTLEIYIKRLQKIEEIVNSFEGIKQSFAVQAGREVRIIVQADMFDDLASGKLARDVAKRIEDELDYPGQIRVTVVREFRATEIAK
jgi:prolyl-tRNA synthetase